MTVLGEILVEHGKEIGKEIGIAEGRTQGIEAFILGNLEEKGVPDHRQADPPLFPVEGGCGAMLPPRSGQRRSLR